MAKPLALTSGEPAGIGPDITLAAWLRRAELNLPAFYVRGDCGSLRDRARTLGLDVRFAETSPEEALATFANALPVVATGQPATARPGQPDDSSANAAIASIRQAVDDVTAARAKAGQRHVINFSQCAVRIGAGIQPHDGARVATQCAPD